jgi:integrase/recombinase XerC
MSLGTNQARVNSELADLLAYVKAKPELPLPAGQELVDTYTEHLTRIGRAKPTVHHRRVVLTYLAANVDVAAATEADIEGWLARRPLSAASRSSYLSCAKGFFRWAVRHELVKSDPTVDMARPRVPRRLPRPIPDRDLAQALELAPDARMRAWLCLAAFQGLRCMEIAGLCAEDVLFDAEPPMLRIFGKGSKERMVPLATQTGTALRIFGVPSRGTLFPNRFGRPYLPATVTQYISGYLRSIGVDCTAHQGRHWFGSSLYKRTRDLRFVQEVLGHTSPTTTAIYTAFAPGPGAAVIRDLGVGVDR